MNLLESVPPKSSSPFVDDRDVVGSNDIPTSSELMNP